MVYEEVKEDISPFLKLYRLSKAKGMGVQQVVDILAIANNDLPSIEKQFNKLRNDLHILQFRKRTSAGNLYQLKNQIVSITTKLLNSFRMSCKRERRGIGNLYNEKMMIANLVTQFKNNNEEYLKIKQTSEEKVKSVLTNGKLLLKFATLSVIESLRNNPELCNFVLYDMSNNTTSYPSNYPSLISFGRQRQQSVNKQLSNL